MKHDLLNIKESIKDFDKRLSLGYYDDYLRIIVIASFILLTAIAIKVFL